MWPNGFSIFATCLLACSTLAATAAEVGQYPNRAIRMIVPFAPGGATDIVARAISPRLSEYLGQPVVIDNRPGAAGSIGVQIAANAAPDGHTLLIGNQGPVSINPALYTKLSHTATRNLIAVTQLADQPDALVVHPSLPVRSVEELVGYAKARKGMLSFGSAGNSTRFEMEMFRLASKLEMTHVPYKGAGPSITALLSGETQLGFVTLSSVMGFVKGGRLRALAITAERRSDRLPDVATFGEAGFPELTGGSWQGVFAPQGTPNAIVDQLFTVLGQKVMTQDEVRHRFVNAGMEIVISKSPADFAQFVAAQNKKWARIVREVGTTEE